MLLDELRLNKNRIEALARQYGARHIRVFGSVARREDSPDSDVDFLVDFPRGYDLLTQRIPLVLGLENLLHRKVELVPEHELNRHIRERVTSEALQILGGAGYTTLHAVERYWRDARLTKIFEGSSEIQQRIISDHLLGKAARAG